MSRRRPAPLPPVTAEQRAALVAYRAAAIEAGASDWLAWLARDWMRSGTDLWSMRDSWPLLQQLRNTVGPRLGEMLCRQCGAVLPEGGTVTCGGSRCQEREHAANKARARRPRGQRRTK